MSAFITGKTHKQLWKYEKWSKFIKIPLVLANDQVLDNVIQNVTSTAFRIFGRLILQNGGLGGGNSGGGGGGGQRVNVVLPTFPPDDDEDYDEDDDQESSSVASVTNGANGLSLPTSTNAPSTLFTVRIHSKVQWNAFFCSFFKNSFHLLCNSFVVYLAWIRARLLGMCWILEKNHSF